MLTKDSPILKPAPWAQKNGKHIAVSLLITGLIVYGGMLLLYAFGVIAEPVSKWPPHAFEIPMSGLASFAIVSLLPSPKKNPAKNNEVEFEAFSLKFSGPAVPATLWIAVYLSIIASFKLLSMS